MNRNFEIFLSFVVALAPYSSFARYEASYERATAMVEYVNANLQEAESEKQPESTLQWIGSKVYEFGDMVRRENYQKVKDAVRDITEYQTGLRIGESNWSWLSRGAGNFLRWTSRNVFYANVETTKSTLLVDYIVKNGASLNLRKSDLAMAIGMLDAKPNYDLYLEIINELKLRNYDLNRVLQDRDTELQYARGQMALMVSSDENYCKSHKGGNYPTNLKASLADAFKFKPNEWPRATKYIKNELDEYCNDK